MPAGVVAQRLDGDIDADLVPVPEAVGDRLGGGVQANLYPFDAASLDALRERLTREARNAQARIFERGAARLLGEGDPDLVRLLRGEVVQAKRRQQADDGGRDPRRDDRGRGVGRELVVGEDVAAAREAHDLAALHEARELRPVNAVARQVARAHGAQATNRAECLGVRRGRAGRHGENVT